MNQCYRHIGGTTEVTPFIKPPVSREDSSVLSIVGHNSRVVVLSPHSDDAALSLAGTLKILADEAVAITILTCFSYSAGLTNQNPGHPDDVTRLRKEEDIIFRNLVSDRIRLEWLDLPDAPLRGHSLESLFLGSGFKNQDFAAKASILKFLNSVNCENSYLFAPLAIGGHIDHRIARQVGMHLLLSGSHSIVFYEDLPYAGAFTLEDIEQYIQLLAQYNRRIPQAHVYSFQGISEFKRMAAACYPSQVCDYWLRLISEHNSRIGSPLEGGERVWRFVPSAP
jgi:LmbE family N-acetylglucosaminyl deacetylase